MIDTDQNDIGQKDVERKYQTKGYLTIYLSQALSLMGSSVVTFAIIWYLTVETGSAIILSLGMFVGMVPMLIIAPFGGVLSDRINKKFLLILPDFLQAVVVVGLIYMFKTGSAEVWHILFLLAIRGVAQAFQMPVNMSLPALMVPKETIPRVNALNSILNSMIFIISPAIGALSLAYLQIGDVLWIDVITYIPAQLVLLFISIPKIKKQISKEGKKSSFVQDFKEGFQYIFQSGLMPMIITVAILSLFVNPLFNLVPLFINVVHNGGPEDLALVEVAFQVGMFLGSIFMLVRKVQPSFRKISVGIFTLFAATLAMALVPTGEFLMIAGFVFFIGISVSFTDVLFLSIMQIIVPPELQGRVFSSVITMMKSSVPIGVIALGVLSDTFSVGLVFIMTPLVAIFMTIFLLLVTGIRKLDQKFETGKFSKEVPSENIVPV